MFSQFFGSVRLALSDESKPAQTLYRLTGDSRGFRSMLEQLRRSLSCARKHDRRASDMVMTIRSRLQRPFVGVGALMLASTTPLSAQTAADSPAAPTYADLADWSDAASMVVRAKIKRQVEVEAERAPGLKPGFARLYIEAETQSLLTGRSAIGEALTYLVDVPRRANGKPPKLKKQEVLLFARPVAGRPGSLQLVAPSAQLPATPELDQRLRPILQALADPAAPPRVEGVRDALPVFGNLVGESETQIFLRTQNGDPASITVVRRPGMAPGWGVSFSEIVDQSAQAPQRETIEWYRLACFLPARLPGGAVLGDSLDLRRLAEQDYAFVLSELGACPRNFE